MKCSPACFSEIYPEANLDLVGLHGLEEHAGAEPVLHGHLLVIPLVQRGLEGQEPAGAQSTTDQGRAYGLHQPMEYL